MAFPHARVIHSGWNHQVDQLVKTSSTKIDLINPFLQIKTVRTLFSGFKGKLRVLTRYKLADFYQGVSDLDALQLLLDYGAEIRGIRYLHAKVYSFDGQCCLVCSANLTDAAMNRNLEVGLITSEPASVKALEENFNALWELSGPSLTATKIVDWKSQVRKVRIQTPLSRPSGLKDLGANLNFGGSGFSVSFPEDNLVGQSRFELENAENYFCKFSASSSDRPSGTKLVEDWIKDCDFTIGGFYPKNKRPRIVRDGDVMFPAVLCADPRDIFVIGRAYALKYVEGDDDATETDKAAQYKDWKNKWPHFIRFRDGEYLDGAISAGVSLNALMAKFGSDSFVTSRVRAKKDSGFAPQKSLRQQAAVRVTYEAAQWINAQLDARFLSLGTVGLSSSS